MEVSAIFGGLSLVELIIFGFIGANMAFLSVFFVQLGAKRLMVAEKLPAPSFNGAID